MNAKPAPDELDLQAQEAVREMRRQAEKLSDGQLDMMFRGARSFNGWTDEAVTDDQIRQIYDLMKMGPTSANVCPLRIKIIRSDEAKAKLKAILFDNNKEKTVQAPAIAIFGNDHAFYEHNAKLTPFRPTAIKERMTDNPKMIAPWANLNGTLQAAYFMMAVRAVGLDAGPMQGLDKPAADEAFWAGTEVKTNFICAFGRGNETTVFKRHPRFDFDEACELL
ncbi:MAG: malonic semialdehyde reductase [Rhodospirillales bacterium]|nr:malonic semialdehyde reductase [Rhodospirillales bacterium]